MTLPPIVPRRASRASRRSREASARPGEALAHRRRGPRARAWVASAPSRRPPPGPSIPRRTSSRGWPTRRSGSGDLPWRAPTTRSVPPATGRAPGAELGRTRLVDASLAATYVAAHDPLSCIALPDPLGRHRQLRARGAPMTLAMRVRDRARGRHAGRLADALGALRPGVGGVELHPVDRDRRRVGDGLRACSRAGAGCAGGRPRRTACPRVSAWPMPITTPPSTWPVGADLVDDHARVVRRGDLEHAHDAGVAVDLDARRVRDQLRRQEGLHAEPADAGRRVDLGRGGHVARAVAEQQRRPEPARGRRS